MQLVLSLFPGIDLLGEAFEREGFCVVQSKDHIFGGDIRTRRFPPGRFDGVIGGPQCQAFSPLAHMVRQNGYEPKFGNLIPEFERVVAEARPLWFAMENVPAAPVPEVAGYEVHSFILNNRQCVDEHGKPAEQNRVRRWSFGYRGERRPLLIDVTLWENQRFEYAATGGSSRPIAIGGSGKPKRFRDGRRQMPFNTKSQMAFREVCDKQGLPDDYDIPSFTVAAKCKAVGNGVPLPMGRAIARAVKEATQDT